MEVNLAVGFVSNEINGKPLILVIEAISLWVRPVLQIGEPDVTQGFWVGEGVILNQLQARGFYEQLRFGRLTAKIEMFIRSANAQAAKIVLKVFRRRGDRHSGNVPKATCGRRWINNFTQDDDGKKQQ